MASITVLKLKQERIRGNAEKLFPIIWFGWPTLWCDLCDSNDVLDLQYIVLFAKVYDEVFKRQIKIWKLSKRLFSLHLIVWYCFPKKWLNLFKKVFLTVRKRNIKQIKLNKLKKIRLKFYLPLTFYARISKNGQ